MFDQTFDLIREGIGKGTIRRGEGPTVFKSNTEDRWYLFIDEFGGRGYVPFETTDLDSGQWAPSQNYQLPSRPRHGTVLPATRLELDRLALTAPRTCTETLTGRVNGPLDVSAWVVCLDRADVRDGVTVSGGASLVVTGGTIRGGLTGAGAGVVAIAGADVRGGVRLDRTTQWARIAASNVAGGVRLSPVRGRRRPRAVEHVGRRRDLLHR